MSAPSTASLPDSAGTASTPSAVLHLLAELSPVLGASAVSLDLGDVPNRTGGPDLSTRQAAGADDADFPGVGLGEVLHGGAVRGRGTNGMEVIVRDDGGHGHVAPVEQADDLRAVRALVAGVHAHARRADARDHSGQYPDVVPEMTGAIGMLQGDPLETGRLTPRLMAEDFFDDLDSLLVHIEAVQGGVYVFFGEKKHEIAFLIDQPRYSDWTARLCSPAQKSRPIWSERPSQSLYSSAIPDSSGNDLARVFPFRMRHSSIQRNSHRGKTQASPYRLQLTRPPVPNGYHRRWETGPQGV